MATLDARVVYVDIDPVAGAHSQQILAGNDRETIIKGPAQPGGDAGHSKTQAFLDFDQPAELLLVAILHAMPDQDDPHGPAARLSTALCPGQLCGDRPWYGEEPADEMGKVAQLTGQTTAPITLRSHSSARSRNRHAPGDYWAGCRERVHRGPSRWTDGHRPSTGSLPVTTDAQRPNCEPEGC
jgi:hypothetical protein